MEFKCLIDWKLVVAAGLAVATVMLSKKVKDEDAPLVITHLFGKAKTELISNIKNN